MRWALPAAGLVLFAPAVAQGPEQQKDGVRTLLASVGRPKTVGSARTESRVPGQAPDRPRPCGDERDEIVLEYTARDFRAPRCRQFSNSSGSRNFTFDELNGGDHRWAWIESALVDGLQRTRDL